MKYKKSLMVCLALIVCLALPFSVGAAGLAGIVRKATGATVSERAQIATLNSGIRQDKLSIVKDIAAIARDIAGAKADAGIAASPDYQTVKSNLAQIKTDVKNAAALDYKSALSGAKGSSNADAALQSVISTMTQKKAGFDTALALAESTKTIADTIYSQKKTDLAAAQSFHQQAVSLKATIDKTHQQIATINDQNKSLINQIVATFSANKNILSGNPAGLAQVETELNTVRTQLGTEYNGKVVAAGKQYDSYRKSRDYTDALAELGTIKSLQNNRITVLQNVQTELTKTLSDLNSLVAAGAGSSAASSTSV